MGIDSTTPQSKLDKFLNAIPQILSAEIFRALCYLGEQCVGKVRNRPGTASWFDQTGNLRSSIGYAVFGEGRKIMESAFDTVGVGTQGSAEGRDMIDSLASKYAETYALVVVAGMNYADYVEAKDNKDVLATTELWAGQQIKPYLEKAIERAYGKILQLQQQMRL